MKLIHIKLFFFSLFFAEVLRLEEQLCMIGIFAAILKRANALSRKDIFFYIFHLA